MDSLWTCGHSNYSLRGFGDLLTEAGVAVVCDVRSYPRSKRHPQFNRESLDPALEEWGIRYCWLGRELGGMRSRSSASRHLALANDGRQGYADHMETGQFRSGIEVLLELKRSTTEPVAVMCAERDWRHCHRSLLADYLEGVMQVGVVHLMKGGEIEPHELSPAARLVGPRLIYDEGWTPPAAELF